MKLILPAYLFLETLSLLMVFTLLTSPPSAEVMGKFERFGYATAAIGVGLSLVFWLKRKYKPEMGILFLVFMLVYPIALWSIYEIVHNSPKLLPQAVKPYALQRAYKTLSGIEKDKELSLHINAVMSKYPVPDDAVRQINLDGIRGLAKLHQTIPDWSKQFYKEQYQEPAKLSMLTNVVNYSRFIQRYDTAFVASLVGAVGPMTSRTVSQLALLHNVDPGLIGFILTKSQREIVKHEIMKLSERRFLREVNKQFPDLVFDDPLNGESWDLIMRRAITQRVIREMGLPDSEDITFPWFISTAQFYRDPALLKLSKHAAPFLFDDNGVMVLSVETLVSKEKVAKVERSLRAGLPDAVKRHFENFYGLLGLKLAEEYGAWGSPVADSMFSGFLRIGAVLPVMLLFSMCMIIFNLFKSFSLSGEGFVWAVSPVLAAYIVFNSFVIDWVVKAVLLVSVQEPILFKG